MELAIFEAIRQGLEAPGLRRMLATSPDLDINWGNPKSHGMTALHAGCQVGAADIIEELLSHPNIDVNRQTKTGTTAFSKACANGISPVVLHLLRDSRVDINLPDHSTSTPLRWAAFYGHHNVILCVIASGRWVNLGISGDIYTDAVMAARERKCAQTALLLLRFEADRATTRQKVRQEIAATRELAAELFALVVLLCDCFLVVTAEVGTPTERFFRVAQHLPMDLQMLLAHRVYRSMVNGIPTHQVEIAMRIVAAWEFGAEN